MADSRNQRMKVVLISAALLFIVLLYIEIAIRRPDHFKIRSAELMSAEYLGDDGVVLQKSSNDCGPSALRMVLDDAGIITSSSAIEQIVPLSKRGATMLDLRSAAKQLGLKLEGWKLSIDSLPSINFPAILFIRKNHYIVADSVVRNSVYVRDPSIGRLRIPIDNISNIWKGEALLIHRLKK